MEYPKIRYLESFPVEEDGQQYIGLRDPKNYSDKIVFVSPPTLFIISLFDGKNSHVDIQAKFMGRYGEMLLSEQISEITSKMDENLFLDNQRFQKHKETFEKEFLDSPVRKSISELRGVKADPEATKKEVESYFLAEDGPGLPDESQKSNSLRGAVLPHIDYKRGGICYAWGYKEIVEKSDADTFVILGTNHTGMDGLYTLTDKDFQTPFGTAPANRDFIEELENRISWNLRAWEFDHQSEHSIELQATFLHSLFHDKRPFSIVPILCGAFPPPTNGNESPWDFPTVREFAETLKDMVNQSKGKVFVIASADLAHMGPQFGDPNPMKDDDLKNLKEKDLETLRLVEQGDGEGFYKDVMRDENRRKICGLSNIYTLLKTTDSKQGKLLRYDQWPDEQGTVSFTSMVFS